MVWAVLAAVAACLALLLSRRVRVTVGFRDDFIWNVRFLFFQFPVKNKRTGKTKRKKNKRKEGPDRLRFFLGHFGSLCDFAKKTFLDVSSRVTVDILRLRLLVHDEDASKTALLYGEACAAVYPAAAAVASHANVKKQALEIRPVFEGEASVEFELVFSMRAAALLRIAAVRLLGLLRSMRAEQPAG